MILVAVLSLLLVIYFWQLPLKATGNEEETEKQKHQDEVCLCCASFTQYGLETSNFIF